MMTRCSMPGCPAPVSGGFAGDPPVLDYFTQNAPQAAPEPIYWCEGHESELSRDLGAGRLLSMGEW